MPISDSRFHLFSDLYSNTGSPLVLPCFYIYNKIALKLYEKCVKNIAHQPRFSFRSQFTGPTIN